MPGCTGQGGSEGDADAFHLSRNNILTEGPVSVPLCCSFNLRHRRWAKLVIQAGDDPGSTGKSFSAVQMKK